MKHIAEKDYGTKNYRNSLFSQTIIKCFIIMAWKYFESGGYLTFFLRSTEKIIQKGYRLRVSFLNITSF